MGPGLLVCGVLAVAARVAAGAAGVGLETALALLLGLALGSVPWIRRPLVPGARWAARVLLRIGVALLGARLTLGAILEGGAAGAVGAALVVVLGLAAGIWLARRAALPERLGWLLAAGMAICGNSAILALAPIVRAEERETTYAVSTITLFGLLGVLLLPVVGRLADLPDGVLGTWAGLAINDTAQVVAAGYAYSPGAGDAATIVKLTRNLAIAPVLVGAALVMARRAPGGEVGAAGRPSAGGLVLRAVPWFVIGFVLFAGLRTAGVLDGTVAGDTTLADALAGLAGWCILLALAGVGLSADLRATLAIGPRPLLVGVALWVLILVAGLLAATVLGGAVYDGSS